MYSVPRVILPVDPLRRELRPERGFTGTVARPRLCGPCAKTCALCGILCAASARAKRYVCFGGTYESSAVCQTKNGGDAGATSASSDVARRSSGPAVLTQQDQARRAVR